MIKDNRKAGAVTIAVISVSAWAAAANAQLQMRGNDLADVVHDAIVAANLQSVITLEQTLLNFLRTPALIDPIVAAKGLVVIPPSIPRSSGCPR